MEAFIKESKEIICKAAKNNKLVVFVGAGVSMNSGYPSWESLIIDFAKGLGVDMSEYSIDDYLKIPQYYYNLRKEKEYYDIVLNKFDIKAEPNKIHELILDLRPAHIITTNYDDLIEKAANRKGDFFDVVAKDSDLPYSINNKMIIKMHGDLKNKNIVLKEDDYLSYFNNFQLIQNYIKSLISTHVVLFIGYSISDINVKYIFQWVKDILKKDFQQAYFIEGNKNKEFNQLEFEYYRNRGVNILYTSACKDIEDFNKKSDYGKLNNDIARSTVKFLSNIIDDESNEILTIEDVYERLKPLNVLNVVGIKDIKLSLDLTLPWIEEERTYFSHMELNNHKLKVYTKKLLGLFEKLKEERIDEKKEIIKKIFYNAGVRDIVDEKGNLILSIDLQKSENINKDIYLFDYNKLENNTKFTIYNDVKGIEKEQLEIAYSLYKLGKFYDAYILLKKISKSCIENKLYYLYFISEFNRYYLGKCISDISIFNISNIGIDSEKQKEVRNEFRKIDLNNIYLKLPNKDANHIDVYRNILTFKFIYRKIGDVISFEKKIKEERNTISCGIGEKDGTVYKLKDDMQYFCEFITGNKLFIDNYIEVKTSFYKFIDIILFSYSLEEKEIEDSIFGMPGKLVKLTEIDYFTIYSMINYLDFKDIKSLFEKYDINKLIVEEDSLKKLMDVNYNIAYALNNIDSIIDIKERYRKFLYIISKINISGESLENVIEYFIETLDNNKKIITEEIVNVISELIVNQSKISKYTITSEIIQKLINRIFMSIKNVNTNNESLRRSMEVLIYNLIYISTKNNIKVNLSEELIVDYIKTDKNTLSYYEMLIRMYDVMSKKNKNVISKRIKKILKSNMFFSYNEFWLYTSAIYNEIIKSEKILESKIINFVDEELRQKEEEKKRGMHVGKIYDIDNLLMTVFYLMVSGNILDTTEVAKYSELNDYIKFIVEDMNVEIFNAKWINNFPDNLNKKLALNNQIKKKIQRYINLNLTDKDTIKTYFKYYCE